MHFRYLHTFSAPLLLMNGFRNYRTIYAYVWKMDEKFDMPMVLIFRFKYQLLWLHSQFGDQKKYSDFGILKVFNFAFHI